MRIFVGIPPILMVGAGRLVIELERRIRAARGANPRLVIAGNKSAAAHEYRSRRWLGFAKAAIVHYWRRLRRDVYLWTEVSKTEPLVLLHIQELGHRWCRKLIDRRKAPLWIYLLDSSFFCIASYNHVRGESTPCTRCSGGNFSEAKKFGCRPFPIEDERYVEFLSRLMKDVRETKVRFLAQNENQANLARSHFGGNAVVETVGLWTSDMSEEMNSPETGTPQGEYDVVFHGTSHPAKGATWLIEVARHCPDHRFLFPFSAREVDAGSPENCVFIPMSWETGLRRQVAISKLTVAGSLWSAPIESALVKSICLARAVAVPENYSAFSNELPTGVALRLPLDPVPAAEKLRSALTGGWAPARGALENWKVDFQRNCDFLDKIVSIISSGRPLA